MPADDKSRYDPAPPIPSYDEAIAGSSTSNLHDWNPPRSPIDDRPTTETEAQSLLSSNRPSQIPPSRRPNGGYRPPHVETDDEDDDASEWTLESEDEETQIRREMQELEIDDGNDSSSQSSWRKRVGFSLPQWRWRWPFSIPRMQVRLPRASDNASGATAENETSTTTQATTTRSINWPKIHGTQALLIVARMLAIILVMGFLYLLFMSDMFTNMSRRIGGQIFDPESVRVHVQNSVDPRRIQNTLKHFTSYAHIAGTEGDYALAMDVRNTFVNEGLEDVTVDEYYVYLNYPKAGGRAVEIVDGDKVIWAAKIEEEEVGGETAGRQTYVFHGHSRSGDVRGPLIYANYGSREDFKRLHDSGIETKGGIALVRYYGTQGDRALKVKAAELAGFVGCIIYSDPAEDGFLQGDVAPNGRYRPADSAQRGAVSLMSWVVGDVLTPGWESKKGQPRMKIDQTPGLNKIPSLPLPWRDAQRLLQSIKGVGEPCPPEWKGGVPDVGDWWTGNLSSPIVRLKNEQDEEEQHPIWNVYGKIAGIEQTEKSIIIGNHRDAWDFGAVDPGSGTAVMLEVARIFGDLTARGWRPLRTIEFMSWDGEEYNLIGSTEFVEKNLDYLRDNAFAYINLDSAVYGQDFTARGSPVFKKMLLKVLDRVGDPNFNTTLKALWEQKNSELEGLGAGSDYVAFQDIAGTSSLDISFEGPPFPYHSSYDNFEWMNRVGDPGFIYHTLLGQVLGLLILELSDRPVLPFDLSNYALSLGKWAGDLWKWSGDKGANQDGQIPFDLSPINEGIKKIEEAVTEFEKWEMKWENEVVSSSGWEPGPLGRQRTQYNSRMAAFETGLLDLEFGGGIPNRTQFKHVVFGPQLWSGYDEAFFPAIRDAVDAQDWALADRIVNKTATLFTQAAALLIAD